MEKVRRGSRGYDEARRDAAAARASRTAAAALQDYLGGDRGGSHVAPQDDARTRPAAAPAFGEGTISSARPARSSRAGLSGADPPAPGGPVPARRGAVGGTRINGAARLPRQRNDPSQKIPTRGLRAPPPTIRSAAQG